MDLLIGFIMQNSQSKLLKNWTEGAENYSNLIQLELNGFQREAWLNIIHEYCGQQGELKVLDVGTGPGFFSIIMAKAGHKVTAIDCTDAMVDVAKKNFEAYQVDVEVMQGDSHCLPFPDDHFDLVISRNVAWTLLDAKQGYKEWLRVLKPGARTLIFDANWNRYLFDDALNQKNSEDIEAYTERFNEKPAGYSDAMLDYRKSMPMCQKIRPQWDLDALVTLGYSELTCLTNINERVYDEKRKVLYRSTPMFMIAATKP